MVLLIYTNEIIEYAHFFRTASPFLYALPIAFYLYYKNHVTKVFRKNRIENLLLLIPIIHFFELLPFYLQSASVKRQYLLSLVNNEDDIREGQEKIENYFERETKYLKSQFRQQDLAKSINMSRNNLSYIVNEVYQMNFNQLLNKKRIEVVIKKTKCER